MDSSDLRVQTLIFTCGPFRGSSLFPKVPFVMYNLQGFLEKVGRVVFFLNME